MNLSGGPVSKVMKKSNILPSEIVVVHDDLDLPVGKLKLCFGRGPGGHNGVDSIISTLSTNEFFRLRVGIGKPQNNMDIAEYVLKPYRKDEKEEAIKNEQNAVLVLKYFISFGLEKAQARYH